MKLSKVIVICLPPGFLVAYRIPSYAWVLLSVVLLTWAFVSMQAAAPPLWAATHFSIRYAWLLSGQRPPVLPSRSHPLRCGLSQVRPAPRYNLVRLSVPYISWAESDGPRLPFSCAWVPLLGSFGSGGHHFSPLGLTFLFAIFGGSSCSPTVVRVCDPAAYLCFAAIILMRLHFGLHRRHCTGRSALPHSFVSQLTRAAVLECSKLPVLRVICWGLFYLLYFQACLFAFNGWISFHFLALKLYVITIHQPSPLSAPVELLKKGLGGCSRAPTTLLAHATCLRVCRLVLYSSSRVPAAWLQLIPPVHGSLRQAYPLTRLLTSSGVCLPLVPSRS